MDMFASLGLYISFSQATHEIFFLVYITNTDSVKIMHQGIHLFLLLINENDFTDAWDGHNGYTSQTYHEVVQQ